ncbi:MAG: DUF4249 domain-containing protein [Cyclobacteriaceae bacterium]|nr:DUF4249 domain-containing protein [Cyclobacteriaceae bacterium SS2]
MKKYLHIGVFLTVIFGCSDDIDLPVAQEILVVEGWLTDQDTIQQVRLSRTVSFESENSSTAVSNATVQIRSNLENYELTHVKNGVYQSMVEFAGIPERSYWIEIRLEDQTITSNKEIMRTVPTLDSVYFNFFRRQSELNPQLEELVYYPVGYFSDNGEEQNFYRWKFKRNEEPFAEPEDIFIQEDRFLNGLDSIKNEFTAFEYELNDTISIELQEISFEAYNYLRLLRLQTTSLGTRSGTTPSVVRGNLVDSSNPSNLILGYFGVISTTSGNRIINP